MAIFRHFLRLSVFMQISIASIMLPMERYNLILTNLTFYDQHYFAAISDSPTGLNQTI